MLKEIIEKKYYRFEERFDNWEEAIKASYTTLVEDGVVEDIYVQAVIECVHKFGPYIVLIPNVAMPHSSEGAPGCNGTAISFMKVEEPVDFDPSDPDKKSTLFFSLAATDHEKHLENIQQLMDVLMNEEVLEKLLTIRTVGELKDIADTYSL